MPRLIEVTPEGRIVAALIEGPKSYGKLKSATGLSDRWLSKKLRELSSARIVERYGDDYQLRKPIDVIDADPVFAQFLKSRISLETKATRIAEELSNDKRIVAVILFGSLAKGKATQESDIDLLLIMDKRDLEAQLNNTIYSLMFKYDAPVEAIFWTYDDLIINLQAKTTLSLGLLKSYRVLYDRGGVEGLLTIKKKEAEENWVYDEESEAWFQRNLMPISKPQKSS